jgi:hypothetical protein
MPVTAVLTSDQFSALPELMPGECRPSSARSRAIENVSPSDTATHLKSQVDIYLQGGSKSVRGVYGFFDLT